MNAKKITLDELTRQERLIIWMRRAGISASKIAKELETTPPSVSRWLEGETILPHRHEQLVNMGIPAELLPPAAYKVGGTAHYAQHAAQN